MSRKRQLAMAGGTVACAMGIGYFMQASSDLPAPAAAPSVAQQSVTAPAAPKTSGFDGFKDVTLTSALPGLTAPKRLAEPKLLLAAVPEVPLAEDKLPRAPASPEPVCDIAARAAPAPMASVDLTVKAPCAPGERMTIHHSGMMFTMATDAAGQARARVPALSQKAVFIVALEGGDGAVAIAEVPDLATYDRVAVQWSGPGAFEIHAREFGAGYGQAGHVWSGGEGSDLGGRVQRLGDDEVFEAQIAEVYTFPRAAAAEAGTIALTVETEVTAENCGRTVQAQSLELRGDAPLRTRDLEMTMPGCEASGDFLVLNNLVDDLKIAAK